MNNYQQTEIEQMLAVAISSLKKLEAELATIGSGIAVNTEPMTISTGIHKTKESLALVKAALNTIEYMDNAKAYSDARISGNPILSGNSSIF